jgi:hypothetical protein
MTQLLFDFLPTNSLAPSLVAPVAKKPVCIHGVPHGKFCEECFDLSRSYREFDEDEFEDEEEDDEDEDE